MTYQKYPVLISSSVLMIVFIVLGMQGFDLVDEGWYLSFYQQIFNAPETVEYNFVYYLTGFLGGIWYQIFPNGGILSFRILAALCLMSTFLISVKILKPYLSVQYIIIALVMVIFVNDFGYLAFYYNHLSGFFAVLIIYFLYGGITKKSLLLIGIAGGLTAINVFSRLPNVMLFGFSIIFFIQFLWVKTISKNDVFRQLLSYLLGTMIGFFTVFLILKSFGHYEIFKASTLGLIKKGQNTSSNHSISRLFLVYLKDYGLILKAAIKISLAIIVILIIKNVLPKTKIFKTLLTIIGVLLFVGVFRVNTIYSLYALSTFGCVYLIFSDEKVDVKILGCLALLTQFLLPLGSDGGIHNAGYVCVWIALPLFVFAVKRKNNFNLRLKSFNQNLKLDVKSKTINHFLIIMVIGFFVLKAYKTSTNAYFDHGSRFYKTYAVNSTLAQGVYTTKERASVVNTILLELKNHVKSGDYLLAYDKIPMLNYLSQTKPYMYNSWVWVYDGEMFKKQMNRAEKEIETLPVIVQQKFETIVNFSSPDSTYMSEHKENNYFYDKGRVKAMNAFIKKHNYKVIWSNDYFNIYKPSVSE